MARYFYGGSGADVIARPISSTDDDLELALGVTYSVYTARTGGTLVTDLLSPAGTPITEITPDAYGVRFQGPNNMLATLWLQNQNDALEPRWAVTPTEWGAILASVLAAVTTPITQESTDPNAVPVTIKGAALQAANLFRVLASDDSIIFSITPDGELRIGPNVGALDGTLRVGITDPAEAGMVVRGAVDQSAKYVRAIDSGAVEQFSVDNQGYISGRNLGGTFGIVGSIVLDAAEAVPAGLPAGTVILRRPAA